MTQLTSLTMGQRFIKTFNPISMPTMVTSQASSHPRHGVQLDFLGSQTPALTWHSIRSIKLLLKAFSLPDLSTG
jgi:hypothetical protein